MTLYWSQLQGFQQVVDTVVTNLSAGETQIYKLTETDIASRLFTISYVSMTENNSVRYRAYIDAYPVYESLSFSGSVFLQFYKMYRASLIAAAAVANYPVVTVFYVQPLTITHKILLGLRLTDEEQKISDDLDLEKAVEEGAYPMLPSLFKERVFKVIRTERKRRYESAASITIRAPKGEKVQLRSINIPTTASLTIKADDRNVAELNGVAIAASSYDMCLTADKLQLTYASTADAEWEYTIAYIKSTDYVKMLFGELSAADNADLYNKVRSGVI